MLIFLVFLSGFKLLPQGVDVNNWQILGSKLCRFMKHRKSNEKKLSHSYFNIKQLYFLLPYSAHTSLAKNC